MDIVTSKLSIKFLKSGVWNFTIPTSSVMACCLNGFDAMQRISPIPKREQGIPEKRLDHQPQKNTDDHKSESGIGFQPVKTAS
ncbi:MAG: hypothetical protein NTY42_11185 [Planctomycetota bacterium]|nr:hypothetical protein [Planctomycetota bacterium]